MISVLQEEVVGPLVLFGSAVRPPMRWRPRRAARSLTTPMPAS